jgi:hypothetical protein
MKASDITLEMVRAAIEKTADWRYRSRVTTEDVLNLVRGWDGSRKANGAPDYVGLVAIEGSPAACEGQIRKFLGELVDQGLVHRSERGQRGYTWRWITEDDRRESMARAGNRAEYRALARRIAARVGDEKDRALAFVGEHRYDTYPVSFNTWSDDDGEYGGAIEVTMDRELAEAFAAWLESRVPAVELPEMTDQDIRDLMRWAWENNRTEVAGWALHALNETNDEEHRAACRRRCAYQVLLMRREAEQDEGVS